MLARKMITPTMLMLAFACANVLAAEKRPARDWMALYEPHTYGDMPCRLMKPIEFDTGKSYPVIVSLHGGGGKGTDNRKQLKDWNRQLADEKRRTQYPCYVLAPQADRL